MKQGYLKKGCLWLFVYPLLFVLALTGLGFYGIAIAIIGATLAFYSSGFRGLADYSTWLRTPFIQATRIGKHLANHVGNCHLSLSLATVYPQLAANDRGLL